MEPHIRPFEVVRPALNPDAPPQAPHLQTLFLPTSPEFAMKRLLVGGLERTSLFQICSAFRDEPESSTHRPEFTMLEWYRAYAGYEDIMNDTEKLLEGLAIKIHGRPRNSLSRTEDFCGHALAPSSHSRLVCSARGS